MSGISAKSLANLVSEKLVDESESPSTGAVSKSKESKVEKAKAFFRIRSEESAARRVKRSSRSSGKILGVRKSKSGTKKSISMRFLASGPEPSGPVPPSPGLDAAFSSSFRARPIAAPAPSRPRNPPTPPGNINMAPNRLENVQSSTTRMSPTLMQAMKFASMRRDEPQMPSAAVSASSVAQRALAQNARPQYQMQSQGVRSPVNPSVNMLAQRPLNNGMAGRVNLMVRQMPSGSNVAASRSMARPSAPYANQNFTRPSVPPQPRPGLPYNYMNSTSQMFRNRRRF